MLVAAMRSLQGLPDGRGWACADIRGQDSWRSACGSCACWRRGSSGCVTLRNAGPVLGRRRPWYLMW